MKLVLVCLVVLALALWGWLQVDAIAPSRSLPVPSRVGSSSVPVPEVSAAGVEHKSAVDEPVRARVDEPTSTQRIRGRLLRGGIGQAGREVVCRQGSNRAPLLTRTGPGGGFVFEVVRGKYDLFAPHAVGKTYKSGSYSYFPVGSLSRLDATREELEVVDDDVDVVLRLPMQAIEVRVRDATTLAPVPDCQVVWRAPPPCMEELHVSSNATGYVRIPDVGVGVHGIAADARAYEVGDREVKLVANGPDAFVELLLRPSCSLDVLLVDEQSHAVAPSGVGEIYLVAKTLGHRVYPSKYRARTGGRGATPFDGMSMGRYEVFVGGDEYDEQSGVKTVQFAAWGVGAEHAVTLMPGRLQRIEVPLRSRRLALVRGVDREGAWVDCALQLERVCADGVLRRVLPHPVLHGGKAHFLGHLAAGPYSMLFTMGGKTFRQPLVVDHGIGEYKVTLPW